MKISVALFVTISLSVMVLQAKEVKVFVSIEPQKFFVQTIGGKDVEVYTMVKPGASPATYEPTPKQMALLSESSLFFSIGVPFERNFLPKLKQVVKGIKVVDTSAGIPLRKMDSSFSSEKSNLPVGGNHPENKGGYDPHIWLNPEYVEIQAETIANALIKINPENKDIYLKNKKDFIERLKELDIEIKSILAPVKGKTFMVFHPAWGYFADAYGLKQFSVEVEGKEPKARQLARIIERAEKEDIRAIFIQSQFSRRLAEKIADSIGGKVVAVNPLAYDYFKNMKIVAEAVLKALRGQK